MADDIFADWKTNRFIVAESALHDYVDGYLVILTDFAFWTLEIDNLTEWCYNNKCKQEGMTVLIPTDKTLMMFILRWSK